MNYKNKIKDIDRLNSEVDRYRPLDKETLRQLKEYYRIGLTYSSNALEGNSLTETETKIVLEEGITIGGKPLRDHYEAIGHSEAYDFLYTLINTETITENDILEFHKLFYYRINRETAGKYREKNVIITGTDFIPPSYNQVPQLMDEFVSRMPEMRMKYHPVEFSARLHLELVTIHPFEDGNGRTARLLMNLALLQSGYVITIIHPIVRNDYLTALKLSQKDEKPFIHFISTMVYESTREYLRIVETIKRE